MLKIFDWVLLLLFSSELQTDQNQFGFEAGSSTSMCSWTAVEVVNYFARKGSPVFAALLDYRKAFDYVNHSKMFRNLINRKINLIFIRLLIYIYLFQECYVKWQSSKSPTFSVTNGTRKGSIFSPRGGFNTYLDPMLDSLRKSGYGCSIGSHFYGVLAYADDVLILATSVQGLQVMVKLCEEHATENDLMFSTDPNPKKSKTMCIAFHCTNKDQLAPVKLNGDNLPWVPRAKHIGNILHEDGSTGHDLLVKKGIFIQTAMELNQEFHYLPSNLKLKLCELYNSHFSGSSIWKLESKEAQQLYSAWNKNLKVIYGLPWATHRWILEEMTGKSLKIILMKRFLRFLNAILKSSKPFLKFLLATVSKDVRSISGCNLRSLTLHSGIQVAPGTSASAVKCTREFCVPKSQEWRLPLLYSLLDIKAGELFLPNNERDDEDHEEVVDEILLHVCTS